MESSSSTASGPIVCHVTSWYFRRMAMMSGILVFMGLYFLYDGRYGYPEDNRIAEKKKWFEEVHLKSYDEAKQAGKLEEWGQKAKTEGLPVGKGDEPPRWVSYAAVNGWPESPKKWSPEAIEQQFWWGGVTLAIGLAVGVVMLVNRNKKLQAESDHWITPEGQTIYFHQVFRVDRRKWDNKGLAYVSYREGPEAKEKTAVLDDLKFAGAVRVLERLQANFKGELIEKQAESPASNDKDDPQAG
ncbi:MAG TPA: hypothetical protein VGE29_06430 [Prosthecobacter sp.]